MSGKPGLGQGTLPEMPLLERSPQIDSFNEQKNFASFAIPEVWGLDRANFDDITPREIAAAAPERLERFLINVKPGSSGEVSMRSVDDNGRPGIFRIALNPQEYGHIVRGVEAIGRAVVSRTYASRAIGADLAPHSAAATKSGVDAIAAKKEKMETYLDSTLLTEKDRLERFLEYATRTGFRRRKGLDMYVEMGWIQDQVFGSMLGVVGLQKNWDQEQADLAKRSVQYRLFFDRSHNKHIANWQSMLGLAARYNQAKIALYSDRIYQSRQYINKHVE